MAAALRLESNKSKKRKPPRVDLPLANSPDQAVIATDLTGKVVFWNLVAERMYGWKWHEAIGRAIAELVVPEPLHGDAAKIMAQLRKGKSWTGEFKLRRRDGTEFVATVTDEPMHDGKGNLIGIIGISRPSSKADRDQ
jgi:PAS domain S-box-containing protein